MNTWLFWAAFGSSPCLSPKRCSEKDLSTKCIEVLNHNNNKPQHGKVLKATCIYNAYSKKWAFGPLNSIHSFLNILYFYTTHPNSYLTAHFWMNYLLNLLNRGVSFWFYLLRMIELIRQLTEKRLGFCWVFRLFMGLN